MAGPPRRRPGLEPDAVDNEPTLLDADRVARRTARWGSDRRYHRRVGHHQRAVDDGDCPGGRGPRPPRGRTETTGRSRPARGRGRHGGGDYARPERPRGGAASPSVRWGDVYVGDVSPASMSPASMRWAAVY